MKLGRLNASLGHLSSIKTGEEPTNIDEGLPDAQLFRVEREDDYYEQIIQFLVTRFASEYFSTIQKKQLVFKARDF